METGYGAPERQIRITVSEEYVGMCIGFVNAANGLVRDMGKERVPAHRIIIVADVPLSAYAKVAAEIGSSTRGDAVVEPVD